MKSKSVAQQETKIRPEMSRSQDIYSIKPRAVFMDQFPTTKLRPSALCAGRYRYIESL
ncbi:MAG: hypothetical protein VX970_01830 [Planctomycetota bacterium]|nr:hypothetical protein [Planctomycetota bacterium]